MLRSISARVLGVPCDACPRLEHRLLLCGLLCLLGYSNDARAHNEATILADYLVTSWSTGDGLPSNRVRAIAQDLKGYLWLGTEDGLVRFDGEQFVSWQPPRAVDRIDRPIYSLLSARDGSLWIGFGGPGGVGRIRNGQLTLFDAEAGIAGRYVPALLEDHAGTMWVGTRDGLFRLESNRWQKQSIDGPVLALHEDRKQRLWVATSAGVFRRTNSGDFRATDIAAPANNLWAGFSEDSTGAMWMTDFHHGFRRIDGETAASGQQGRGWGARLLLDARMNLWIATQGQGLWLARNPRTTTSPVEILDARHGFSGNTVYALLEDADKNIWVGTSAGLARLSPRKVRSVTDIGGVLSVAGSDDGGVWVGTNSGLVRISPGGRRIYGEADGLPSDVILSLHTDTRGTLWVITNNGLARFVGGRFRSVPIAHRRPVERVSALANSSTGVWIADSEHGLLHYKDGVLERVSTKAGEAVPPMPLGTLCVDGHGTLWFNRSDGRIAPLIDDDIEPFAPNVGTLGALFADRDGVLWIGGRAGLSRYRMGRVTTITAANGLPVAVRSITQDVQGHLWIGTDAGIVRLEQKEFDKAVDDPAYQIRYRLLNESDGVAGRPNAGKTSAARAQDGRLWFLTSNGVSAIDPERTGEAPAPPAVHIEAVIADAEVFDLVHPVLLRPHTRHLRVIFAAPTLTDPARVRFQYRLDGFDDRWIDASQRREISYTNLPPQRYRLRVVATSSDGVWAHPGASLEFTVQHAFYQRVWFKTVVVLMCGLLLWALWQWRARHTRRQFALVLTERIRIGRAIHDTVLQGLVGLALQCDDIAHTPDATSAVIRERLSSMRRQIEGFIREARHSIFDLRSPVLEAGDLAATLAQVAARATAGRSVQVDVVDSGSVCRVSPRVGEQVILIAQEAVSNAVRHGKAQKIRIELVYDKPGLRLRVVDDGCGFDHESVWTSSSHFGLTSMRERAEDVQGYFKIVTAKGRGTEIEAVFPAWRLVA